MIQRLFRATIFVCILLAGTSALAAHKSVIVTADDVVLRSGANKHTRRLVVLKKGRHLRLLDLTPKNGFFHVKTADTDGWVSTDFAELLDYDSVTGGPAAAPEAALAFAGNEQATLENFHKIPSNAKTVTINGKSCPAGGRKDDDPDELDTATNIQKNRTDKAEDHGVQYVDIRLETLRKLPYPEVLKTSGLKNRADWTGPNSGIAGEIARYEGVPVRVKGYLAAWRDEGDESCNCEYPHVENHDVHLAFTAAPGQGEEEAVVMEITPRIKRAMQHWKHKWLSPSEENHRPVRISGWLMFDPKHPEMLGEYRHTLWEVHPITKLEVMQGNKWVDIEDLAQPE
jgi:hypothetical protein